jgi:hypothetical protein
MCLEEEHRLAKQREQQPVEMESPEEQKQDKPQQPYQQNNLPEWLQNVELASPEELAEEKRGWDRHRHKQKRRLDGTLPTPDSPKKPSR